VLDTFQQSIAFKTFLIYLETTYRLSRLPSLNRQLTATKKHPVIGVYKFI